MNCKGCPVLPDLKGREPEPMSGRLFNTNSEVEAMFIGDAPNFTEKEAFSSPTVLVDRITKENVKAYLTNLYKCRRGFTDNDSNHLTAQTCRDLLSDELDLYLPCLVVTVGSHPSQVLTGRTPYELEGATTASWNGYHMTVIVLPSPSNPDRRSLKLYEDRWQLIVDYLKERRWLELQKPKKLE